jgi:hypothetical protein
MLSDKAPFLVTLIIAGLAWTLTSIVDRLLATPMLLQRIEDRAVASKQTTYITLKNITRDKTFRKLRLLVTAAPNTVLKERPQVIPYQPAWEGDHPGIFAGKTFDFTFSEIQPNWQFEIAVSYEGNERPSIRLSLENETIYVIEPSLETFLVENDTVVFAGLVVLWLGLLAIFVVYRALVGVARWLRS